MTDRDTTKTPRDGIPLDGKASDRDIYAGPDIAYDTAIAVNDEDNEDDNEYETRERAIAR